jgi:hypothetical protein
MTHGLIKDLESEHAVTVLLEENKVPDLNGASAGKLPPALLEVHLAYPVEHHLHGPQADLPPGTHNTISWGLFSWSSTIDVNF